MLSHFEKYSVQQFDQLFSETSELFRTNFLEGLKYSFFSGGKRMRPYLIGILSDHLGLGKEEYLPAAFALECIHTYSLIHDDLPCMDDDVERRGQPTHHVKYGEAHAVLSGDALLTYAFEVLARSYPSESQLVARLAQCAGPCGMVGGQVLDCLTQERNLKIFEEIHYLKTAKLFEFATWSPFLIAKCSEADQIKALQIGKHLGLLFQLQDDLLDIDKKEQREEENITAIVSLQELKDKIDSQKHMIQKLSEQLDLVESSSYQEFLQKLFDRQV